MTVEEAINKRYSTRNYIPNKKISEEDLNKILMAGIKAPNGFGVEPWLFYALDGDKSDLCKACMEQEHIATSSHVIIFACVRGEYIQKNPDILINKLRSNGLSEETIEARCGVFSKLDTQYYKEQVMFACSQMILQATELGIGSVPVGGLIPSEVAKIINIDTDKYQVALGLSLGYNADTVPKVRTNRPFEEVVIKMTL